MQLCICLEGEEVSSPPQVLSGGSEIAASIIALGELLICYHSCAVGYVTEKHTFFLLKISKPQNRIQNMRVRNKRWGGHFSQLIQMNQIY